MNNWGFLHLLIRQVHHPHDQLRGNLLLQHAPMPQQQIEHLRIDRQHQQAVLIHQIQVMIRHGDVLQS